MFSPNLCQTSAALFLCKTSPVTQCYWKSMKKYSKSSSFTKEQRAPERGKEAALWKGTWPLALQPRPGSQQRATVVITERLIADRTFQQPVVNWMELRGRKLQMHRHDRCSADDLYFRVVQGHACHFLLLILLLKLLEKLNIFKLQTLSDIFLQKDEEK